MGRRARQCLKDLLANISFSWFALLALVLIRHRRHGAAGSAPCWNRVNSKLYTCQVIDNRRLSTAINDRETTRTVPVQASMQACYWCPGFHGCVAFTYVHTVKPNVKCDNVCVCVSVCVCVCVFVVRFYYYYCNGVEWSKDKTQAAESIKWRPQQAYGSNQFLLVQPQTVFSTHTKSSRSRHR